MFKAGTLPFNMYRTSDYPKDKVSFSHNTVGEQPATSATTVKPFISHEVIEKGKVAEEAEVDTDYPTRVDNDEEDSL